MNESIVSFLRCVLTKTGFFILVVKVVILLLQIRDFVSEQMSVRGIEFHTEESPQAIIKAADGSLTLKTNRGAVEGFSHVMFATGRRPNTKVWNFYLVLGFSGTGIFRFMRLRVKKCTSRHMCE